jgi:hypothetical protein
VAGMNDVLKLFHSDELTFWRPLSLVLCPKIGETVLFRYKQGADSTRLEVFDYDPDDWFPLSKFGRNAYWMRLPKITRKDWHHSTNQVKEFIE